MRVRQLLETKRAEPTIVGPDATIRESARLLAGKRKGLALVCTPDGRLLGVVSVMDINRAVAEHGERAPAMPVKSIMTADFCACQLEDSIEDVLREMTTRSIRHVPVVEDGQLKGLVNLRSLLEARIDLADLEAAEIRGYISGVGYH